MTGVAPSCLKSRSVTELIKRLSDSFVQQNVPRCKRLSGIEFPVSTLGGFWKDNLNSGTSFSFFPLLSEIERRLLRSKTSHPFITEETLV